MSCGEPDARERARPVRRAGRGNGPAVTPTPRPGPTRRAGKRLDVRVVERSHILGNADPIERDLAPDLGSGSGHLALCLWGPPRWRADPPPPARPPGRATLGWRSAWQRAVRATTEASRGRGGSAARAGSSRQAARAGGGVE